MTEVKYRFIIGIDPDTNKSGIAFYDNSEKKITVFELELWKIFNTLLKYEEYCLVRLEAGHKVKSTWHKGGNGMAKRVGANHEIGRQIEKFCIEYNIPFELVKPCGLSNINHETFCKITGWDFKKLTNPEKRVAGLLAFGKK